MGTVVCGTSKTDSPTLVDNSLDNSLVLTLKTQRPKLIANSPEYFRLLRHDGIARSFLLK
jgi:hypothetical protein